MAAEKDLNLRNTLARTSNGGVYRNVNGRREIAPWESVTKIHATLAYNNGRTIRVVSIGFDDGRTLLISEIEPGWAEIVGALHSHLAIEPYKLWGPRILANPEVHELFIRAET